MALSTLRVALRPSLLGHPTVFFARCVPMATSAEDQMKAYWKKNIELKRPNSPWLIYKWQLPMLTSLTHRVTGIAMTCALYTISIGLFMLPDTIPHYIEWLKSFELGPVVWFPLKTIAAFPLVFHYLNAIRHLSWDFYGGYEVKTQLRTGWTAYIVAGSIAVFFAGYAYM